MGSDYPAVEGIEAHDAQPDCPVCLGPHHEEIHDASLSVRRWFRQEIARRTAPPPPAF